MSTEPSKLIAPQPQVLECFKRSYLSLWAQKVLSVDLQRVGRPKSRRSGRPCKSWSPARGELFSRCPARLITCGDSLHRNPISSLTSTVTCYLQFGPQGQFLTSVATESSIAIHQIKQSIKKKQKNTVSGLLTSDWCPFSTASFFSASHEAKELLSVNMCPLGGRQSSGL